MNKTNVKIKTGALGFKDYASFYSVEILYSFNFELQLKDTESAISSKLKNLLFELRGFKFVTTLVLMLKKIESQDKIKYLFMKVTLMIMNLYQSILQLYETYKDFKEKVHARLLIQS